MSSEEGSYVCKECGKKFKSWFSLMSHMRVHKKPHEKPPEKTEVNDDMKSILKSIMERIEALEERLGGSPIVKEEKIKVEDYPTMRKTIEIYPETVQYYYWYIAKTGKKVDWDTFINDIIDEHFRECCGIRAAIVVDTQRRRG